VKNPDKLMMVALVAAAWCGLSIGCGDDDDDKSAADQDASTSTVNAADADSTRPRVKIEDGELEGRSTDGQVRSFLGIPYAKPPVGELRWKEPQRPDQWTDVRDASEFGGRCAQLSSTTLQNPASDNEDCLYLNVWTAASATEKLPVMVWIHGGGNVNGSASELLPYVNSGYFYSGEFFAQRQVVLVSFNYRLGVLGFLAHPDLPAEGSKAANQGLWDQQFALQWVKRNIDKFGGDPNKVTIFGESAGSFDVCLHVASPKSRDFINGAISESGGCTTLQKELTSGQQLAQDLATKLGCTGTDSLACLRKKTVDELLNAVAGTDNTLTTPAPVVDGDFLPEQTRALYDAGNIAKVPYILGSNTDEGTLFVVGLTAPTTQDEYLQVLTKTFTAAASAVAQRYPAEKFNNSYQAALARAVGDARLVCTTYDVAVRAAKAGASVYMYNFDVPVSNSISGLDLGATHGAELIYVFATSQSFNDQTRAVSDRMQTYWTNFAKTGDPNGADLLTWPQLSESENVRVNFALDSTVVTDFRAEECAFWRTIYNAQFSSK